MNLFIIQPRKFMLNFFYPTNTISSSYLEKYLYCSLCLFIYEYKINMQSYHILKKNISITISNTWSYSRLFRGSIILRLQWLKKIKLILDGSQASRIDKSILFFCYFKNQHTNNFAPELTQSSKT